jgi:hypothetical protein
MPRKVTASDLLRSGSVGIGQGGTSATAAPAALTNLNGIALTAIDQPNGVLGLDASNKVSTSKLQINSTYGPTVIGPSSLNTSQTGIFTITNFDIETVYTITAVSGSVVVSDETITYTAPATVVAAGIVVNGRTISVTIGASATIAKPQITFPTAALELTGTSLTATCTVGATTGTIGNLSGSWEISAVNTFATTVQNASGNTRTTSWVVGTALANSATYYIRVRHYDLAAVTDPTGNPYGPVASPWSDIVTFTTPAAGTPPPTGTPKINDPTIATPLANATGVSINPSITSSAYSITDTTETHTNSDWEISTSSTDFSTPVKSSYNNTTNKVSWSTSGLAYSTNYWVRVKHKSASLSSGWSAASKFTTDAAPVTEPTGTIAKPSISLPGDNATNVDPHVNLTVSAFSISGSSETFTVMDFDVSVNSSFSPVSSVLISSSSSTATSASFIVDFSTELYIRVRHRSQNLVSAWSDTKHVTTRPYQGFTFVGPSVTSPGNGTTDLARPVTIQLSDVSGLITKNDFTGTINRIDATWYRYSLSTDFSGSASVVLNADNSTSFSLAGLGENTTYYIQAMYMAVLHDEYGDYYSSYTTPWGPVSSFKTSAVAINTPITIVPSSIAYNATSISVSANAFSTTPTGTDTHKNTDWELYKQLPNGTWDLLSNSINDATNLTSWTVSIIPEASASYGIYVRYRGWTDATSPQSTFNTFSSGAAPVVTYTVDTPTVSLSVYGTTITCSNSTIHITPDGSSQTGDHTNWQFATNNTFTTGFSEVSASNMGDYAYTGTAGTTYYVRAQHVSSGGLVSSYSAYQSILVPYPPSIDPIGIANPINGSTGNPTSGSVQITPVTFTNAPSATHNSTTWKIGTQSGVYTQVIANSSNKTSHLYSGALYSTTYYVMAIAHTSLGDVSTSEVSYQIMPDPTPPAVVTTIQTPVITNIYRNEGTNTAQDDWVTIIGSAYVLESGTSGHADTYVNGNSQGAAITTGSFTCASNGDPTTEYFVLDQVYTFTVQYKAADGTLSAVSPVYSFVINPTPPI